MKDWLVPIVAIVCVTGLEVYALSQGMNGVLMSGCVAVIGGITGYKVKAERDKRKAKNGG